MKTAKAVIVPCYEVICPHCEENVECPKTSSHIWSPREYGPYGKTAICTSCHAEVKIPAAIHRDFDS